MRRPSFECLFSTSPELPRIIYSPVTIKEYVTAAHEGNMATVRCYIQDNRDDYAAMNASYENQTALLAAVAKNQIAIVNELLKNEKIDISVSTQCWNTALHFAADNGSLEIVKALLIANSKLRENESILNLANTSGNTPLILAATKNHVDVVSALLNAGAKLNNLEMLIDRLKEHHVSLQIIKLILAKHNEEVAMTTRTSMKKGY